MFVQAVALKYFFFPLYPLFRIAPVQDDDTAISNGHPENATPGPMTKNPRVLVSDSDGGGASQPQKKGSNGMSIACTSTATAAFHHQQEVELDGLPCLVKVYDFPDGQLKLNDTAEFVGVLAYDQSLPQQENASLVGTEGNTAELSGAAVTAGGGVMSDPFQGLEDFSRKIPPASLAPRLHCICETKSRPS